MSRETTEKVKYGNWVSKWLLYMPAATALFFLALSSVSRWFTIAAAFFFIVFAYFALAYLRFSPSGGDLQTKIRDLVLKRLEWNGRGQALDIGCGNGALVIKLAGQYPQAQVTGIDYWGGNWGYSREACRKNAKIEGVSARTTFKKASASSLPFKDSYFDVAVSNFVFHEVKDAKDKREVLKEALRVVKKGGIFVFQDLFLAKTIYGDLDDLLETIRGWGVREVNFENTSKRAFIPGFLKLPFMVGAIAIIYGKK